MGYWYCTREDIRSALDIKMTARVNAQIDRAIESASRSVEDLCHRRFYPEIDTRYFDWPNEQDADSWRLWLEENELASATGLVVASGDLTISSDQYYLEPNWGPPFDRLELRLDKTASFGNADTSQRDISINGLFGYDDVTVARGTLAATCGASDTTISVTDSTVGVGDLLLVDSERLVVTAKAWMATSDTLATALTASKADDQVPVTSGAVYTAGEELLVGSETLLVVDISSNTLIVERAWSGSTLAAHDVAAAVSARRTLTVTRAAAGTTAAGHLEDTVVSSQVYPGPVVSLTVAEALNTVLQEQAGYARTVGSGDAARNASGAGLADARKQCMKSHGRKARTGAV